MQAPDRKISRCGGYRRWTLGLAVALALSACSTTPESSMPSAALPRLSAPTDMVEQETAVAWALRHDPEWQALLLSDELLQLQLRRDGRWRNPGLSVGRVTQGAGAERELGVDLDVLGLLTWPVRMQLSGQALAQARIQSRIRLMQQSLLVRLAWIEAVAATQRLRYAEHVAETAQAAHTLAKRMKTAGTLSGLEAGREEAFWLESEVALREARTGLRLARDHLARKMGLAAPDDLRLPDQLPPLPPALPETVTDAAFFDGRLDVGAARAEADILAGRLRLGRATRMVNVLELGLDSTRSTGQPVQRGQTLRLELPLFDAGVSRVREADLRYRQALAGVGAVALAAHQEWRQARAEGQDAWETARLYQTELMPLQQRLLDEVVLRYNGMLADTFEVLTQSREQIRVRQDALKVQARYWRAQAMLQHVQSAPLPRGES
jgi:outer membrane protein TolC